MPPGDYWEKLSSGERRKKLKDSLLNPEVRVRARLGRQAYWNSLSYEERLATGPVQGLMSEEAHRRSVEGIRKYWDSLSYKERVEISGYTCQSEAAKLGRQEAWDRLSPRERDERNENVRRARANIGWRSLVSHRQKEYWANLPPVERERRISELQLKSAQANKTSPTFPELVLMSCLEKWFPDAWKYNGDGGEGVSVGGRIPDFVSATGGRVVIEVFGNYWHVESDAERRIQHYQDHGYKCIVVWDHECHLAPGELKGKIGLLLQDA